MSAPHFDLRLPGVLQLLIRIWHRLSESPGQGETLWLRLRELWVDDLKRRMRAGEDFTLIDVRKPEVWAESNADIGSDPQARSSLQQDLDDQLHLINFPAVGACLCPFPLPLIGFRQCDARAWRPWLVVKSTGFEGCTLFRPMVIGSNRPFSLTRKPSGSRRKRGVYSRACMRFGD
ncbi:MAG: hypothetical protein DMG97_21540 [Acidobacteria bacterium]|nr:MAG: hypothetical protein DMG97_21540 [Acidobacteriota bacterium]PYV77702.1 MAG: hypothetical protein DMG96_10325 [Acidobacteriota bacterium]